MTYWPSFRRGVSPASFCGLCERTFSDERDDAEDNDQGGDAANQDPRSGPVDDECLQVFGS